jgi:drug/metabolite transporter (DMT)-like permease
VLILRLRTFHAVATWRVLRCWGVSYAAIALLLFTLALRFISSGVQGILLATMPLLAAVGAHWLVPGERLNGRKLLGLALGLLGVGVMMATRTDGLGAAGFDARGYLFSLVGALAVAASVILGRLRLSGHDPVGVAGFADAVWAGRAGADTVAVRANR